MKNFALIVSLMLCSLAAEAGPKKTVRICYGAWAPAMIPPGGKGSSERHGFLVDMFAEIYSQNGYQVTFQEMPYLRAVREVESGNCDMSPSATLAVSSTALFSKTPSYFSEYVFFSRREVPFKYTGVDSLKKVIVGNVPGYDYSSLDPDFQKYLNQKNNKMVMTVSGNASVDRLFRQMAMDRVDVFCEDLNVGSFLIDSMGIGKDVKIAGALSKKLQLYAIFSPKDVKKSNELIRLFEAELEKNKDLREKYISRYKIKALPRE